MCLRLLRPDPGTSRKTFRLVAEGCQEYSWLGSGGCQKYFRLVPEGRHEYFWEGSGTRQEVLRPGVPVFPDGCSDVNDPSFLVGIQNLLAGSGYEAENFLAGAGGVPRIFLAGVRGVSGIFPAGAGGVPGIFLGGVRYEARSF